MRHNYITFQNEFDSIEAGVDAVFPERQNWVKRQTWKQIRELMERFGALIQQRNNILFKMEVKPEKKSESREEETSEKPSSNLHRPEVEEDDSTYEMKEEE